MLGGGRYVAHQMFGDLFNRQSFTDNVTFDYKLEVLQTAEHELGDRKRRAKHDLFNPWSWIRFSFERLVGFPRYVLAQAGFGSRVTDSGIVRVLTVVWSLLIGAAGIGSFIVGLLALWK
jgi:hypothetical protein